MTFKPGWIATGIGSLPVSDAEEGVSLVLRYLPEIPFWPQLPQKTPLEGMIRQYSEGMPCLKSDDNTGRIWIETNDDLVKELETFYEHFLSEDIQYFGLGRSYASGFHALTSRLRAETPKEIRLLKGHVTGPVTMGMGLRDRNGGYVIYNSDIFDAVLKTISMKAVWQVEELQKFGYPVIIFMDEPAMESFGSAYFNVSREDITTYWNEITGAIKQRGGITGLHCCGNMDWSMPFKSDIDIINFDAYEHADKIALYPDELKRFLERGGVLAWGIVPTDRKGIIDTDFLVKRLGDSVNNLISLGIDRKMLNEQSMITPSCGMGSLTTEEAVRILETASAVSSRMKSGQA